MADQQFLQLLQTLQTPNTEAVRAATATLKQDYYTNVSSLTALLQILISGQPQDIQQLAAVQCKNLVPKHWTSVPQGDRPQLRQALLECTLNDDNKLVRHAKAWVVAAIAETDVSEGSWADLPAVLQQAATSQSVKYREVGVFIIFTLLEKLPEVFEDNVHALLALFNNTIKDPESLEVRSNTMQALVEVAISLQIEEDPAAVQTFLGTIPHMVQFLKDCIENDNDEYTSQAFDVLNQLMLCSPVFLNANFKDIIHFMIEVAANTNANEDARVQAISWIEEALSYRKTKFQGLRIGESLTVKALNIVVELDEDADDDDSSPARSALELLAVMARNLNPSQVAVPLLNALGPYVQSNDHKARQAAMLSLAMVVDGNSEFLSTQLQQILPVVFALLEDSNTYVRSATLHCVSNLAESLRFDMSKEHARLVPALIKALTLAKADIQNDPTHKQNIAVMKAGIIAVGPIVESLESTIAAQYLDNLFSNIAPFLEHNDIKIQYAAIMSVGQIAGTVGAAYKPYFDGTMQVLGRYVSQKESEEELTRRGIVCDTLGQVASAVGKEQFQPYLPSLMQASEEALHLDHPKLRETTYMLWGELSKVYAEDFAPYLSGALKGLIECLNQEEKATVIEGGDGTDALAGQEITLGGRKFKVADTDEDDMNDDDEGDVNWADEYETSNAIAEEKEIAIEAMGEIMNHTGVAFLPFIQQAVEAALPLADHGDESVCKAAINTCWRAYINLTKIGEKQGMPKWKPGLPLQVEVSDDLKKLGNLVMTKTLSTLPDEADSNAVEEINCQLAEVLKECGPAVLVSTDDAQTKSPVTQLVDIVLSILRKKHLCQTDMDDDTAQQANEPSSESSEYEWQVIDSALDVVSGLSRALGPAFGPLIEVLEKPIAKYTSSLSKIERSSAVGSLAECIDNTTTECTPYTSHLMRIFVKRLTDDDPDTRSNAAYGSGVLCLHSNDEKEVLSNYPSILQKLEPLLRETDNARLLDNACGCVARMIHRHPAAVPLAEVVPALVNLLPLREDFAENKAVYDCLISLYQANNEHILKQTPAVMLVLQKVISAPEDQDQLDPETRTKCIQLGEHLQQQQ